MWILKEENRNSLVIGSSRTEGTVQPSILEQLGVHKWADVQYDLALELSRFGVGYSITQAPLTVTYWDNLVVDETLSEARLLAVVVDIQRVDKLVNLIVSKETVSVRLSQPTSPRFEDFQRSMSPT
jgi:hypothetical protein